MPRLLVSGDHAEEACDLVYCGRNLLVYYEITTPSGRTIKGAGRVKNVIDIYGVPTKFWVQLVLEDNPPENLETAERLYAPGRIGGWL